MKKKKKKIVGDEVFFNEMVENFTSLARYHKALGSTPISDVKNVKDHCTFHLVL